MKVFLGIALLVALYFTFLHNSTFKQSFNFGTDYYSYSRSQRGGDFENYFYTIGGEESAGLRQLVQIVEFPENVLPEQYNHYMKPLFSRYQLKSYEGDELRRVGDFKQAGLSFKSYSSPVEIDGQTHMAFYLSNVKEQRGARQILSDLAGITFD